MENYTRKEREQYNMRRAAVCDALGITTYQYNWLRRKGETLRNLYIEACNGFSTQYDQDKNAQAQAELTLKLTRYASYWGLFVYFQDDPRGSTLYLSKDTVLTDADYNQGHAIY